MRKALALAGMALLIVSFTCIALTGCAPEKKALVDDRGAGVSKSDQLSAAEQQRIKDEEARQRALREQELREKAMRDREAAASAAKGSGLENIYFGFDQYGLTEEARATLKRHAEWLRANRGYIMVIEGHCDERGTNEYNLALGQRRADAAKKYLVSLGVEARRLSTVSYGEEKPLDPGHDEAAWAKNRRAQFTATKQK
ncbi:MAG TPA: peptidoglycan-associated lipoprotein Pal [Syntrophales bacterium]|nr:peptidoglycan-associated lipoprotein Pal [Syntrophales bacterium]HOX94453.1 peptidoglycan-associated lipoprotein Pal [Syntrophales bacterium]HPI56737.1 peptidoglycan-associated lipoprotein Pal [Syntrophales bacterium]HPN24838.1 peptidoglycan-associated lipoprotein Pal [Syntrophales bacterium]HQM30273.1 peptidoglycan-associated lipoprotein Pal [Syntrophales bacterium]